MDESARRRHGIQKVYHMFALSVMSVHTVCTLAAIRSTLQQGEPGAAGLPPQGQVIKLKIL